MIQRKGGTIRNMKGMKKRWGGASVGDIPSAEQIEEEEEKEEKILNEKEVKRIFERDVREYRNPELKKQRLKLQAQLTAEELERTRKLEKRLSDEQFKAVLGAVKEIGTDLVLGAVCPECVVAKGVANTVKDYSETKDTEKLMEDLGLVALEVATAGTSGEASAGKLAFNPSEATIGERASIGLSEIGKRGIAVGSKTRKALSIGGKLAQAYATARDVKKLNDVLNKEEDEEGNPIPEAVKMDEVLAIFVKQPLTKVSDKAIPLIKDYLKRHPDVSPSDNVLLQIKNSATPEEIYKSKVALRARQDDFTQKNVKGLDKLRGPLKQFIKDNNLKLGTELEKKYGYPSTDGKRPQWLQDVDDFEVYKTFEGVPTKENITNYGKWLRRNPKVLEDDEADLLNTDIHEAYRERGIGLTASIDTLEKIMEKPPNEITEKDKSTAIDIYGSFPDLVELDEEGEIENENLRKIIQSEGKTVKEIRDAFDKRFEDTKPVVKPIEKPVEKPPDPTIKEQVEKVITPDSDKPIGKIDLGFLKPPATEPEPVKPVVPITPPDEPHIPPKSVLQPPKETKTPEPVERKEQISDFPKEIVTEPIADFHPSFKQVEEYMTTRQYTPIQGLEIDCNIIGDEEQKAKCMEIRQSFLRKKSLL